VPSEAAEAAERPSLRTRQRGTLRGRQTASFLASNLPMARRETEHRLDQARLKPQRMWPLQLPLLSTGPPIIRCASTLPRGAVEQRLKPFLAKPVRAFAFARATVMTPISAAIWAAMIYRRAAYSLPAEAEIFAFADGKPVVAEYVVRRRHVKIEVWQREVQEIVPSTRLSQGPAGIV
jgi:hypothetical protein